MMSLTKKLLSNKLDNDTGNKVLKMIAGKHILQSYQKYCFKSQKKVRLILSGGISKAQVSGFDPITRKIERIAGKQQPIQVSSYARTFETSVFCVNYGEGFTKWSVGEQQPEGVCNIWLLIIARKGQPLSIKHLNERCFLKLIKIGSREFLAGTFLYSGETWIWDSKGNHILTNNSDDSGNPVTVKHQDVLTDMEYRKLSML